VTDTFGGSRAVTEEDTTNLVNSKDVVTHRVRDIQAQAIAAGPRAGDPRGRTARGAAWLRWPAPAFRFARTA
jgi:hypothetical protein